MIAKFTMQMNEWAGAFGKKYAIRNNFNIKELNLLYEKSYGVSRLKLNKSFIGNISRSAKILEVGCNVGNQLLLLQQMGFKNLYGIDINQFAIEFSKQKTRNINIITGSAFDIPFKDNYFDIVCTNGVLIHIGPNDLKHAMGEIYRVSRKYIWGYECYSDKKTAVWYRKKSNLFWRNDFVKFYLKYFNDLKLQKLKKLVFRPNGSTDIMFLLRKV